MTRPKLSLVLSTLLVVAVLLLVAAPTALANAPTQTAVTATTTDILRLRSGPGTTYSITGRLPSGATVPVLGRSAASDWFQVTYSGLTGWVAASYCTVSGDLSAVPVTEPAAPAVLSATGVTAAAVQSLRIRAEPGFNGRTIGLLPAGLGVPVAGRNEANSWLQIIYNGAPGWVSAWYTVTSGDLNAAPVTVSQPPSPYGRSISAWEYHNTHYGQGTYVEMRPEWFEAQMRWLSENGYHGVSSEELVGYLNGAPLPPKSIVLTFDLGDRQLADYEQTVQILQRYGMHAIFFMVAGNIVDDCSTGWPCWEALQRWQASGTVSFGSHSINHRSYAYMTPEQVMQDLVGSKQILESHLGPILGFAYPYEATAPGIDQMLRAAGYLYSFGGNERADLSIHPFDPLWFNLPRLLPYSSGSMYPVLTARAPAGATFADVVTSNTSP